MSTITKVGGYLATAIGGGAVVWLCATMGFIPTSEAAEASTPQTPSPQMQALMATPSFDDALRLVLPDLVDATEKPCVGAERLSEWMAKYGSAADLARRVNTTLKVAKKDMRAGHGKVVCVAGKLDQIARDTTTEAEVYIGLLWTDESDRVYFYAGGDSGALVEGDHARFCGVVAGDYSFTNVSGGETPSVHVVGTFDLGTDKAR